MSSDFNLHSLNFSWKINSFIKILKFITISFTITYFIFLCFVTFPSTLHSVHFFFDYICQRVIWLYFPKNPAHRFASFFFFQVNDFPIFVSRNATIPSRVPWGLCTSPPSPPSQGRLSRSPVEGGLRGKAASRGATGGPRAQCCSEDIWLQFLASGSIRWRQCPSPSLSAERFWFVTKPALRLHLPVLLPTDSCKN